MPTSYNSIAGRSVERLAALSDGIFAVAMTLLVLDIHAPAVEAVHTEHDLWGVLVALAPRLVMFAMSFLTLGIFWIGQQTQLNHLERSERSLTWIHLAFLAVVCLVPFTTSFLAEFIRYRGALVVYWLNISLLGITLYFSWVCALGLGVVKSDLTPDVAKAIKGRIFMGQALYAFGLLLCVFNTCWSIGFMVWVQLYLRHCTEVAGAEVNGAGFHDEVASVVSSRASSPPSDFHPRVPNEGVILSGGSPVLAAGVEGPLLPATLSSLMGLDSYGGIATAHLKVRPFKAD